LLGHSAGATLAFQLLMGSQALKGAAVPSGVALPAAIVGLEGIYDFEGLVRRKGPGYRPMFVGAFGDEKNWDEASPAKFKGGFRPKSGEMLAVVGWGPDDELIDQPEIDAMVEVLERDGVRRLVLKDLEGTHDGMWEDGRPLARVIARTFEEMTS
jgi:kynurenine formamidase